MIIKIEEFWNPYRGLINPKPRTTIGMLVEVLNYLYENWENENKTDLNHLIAYKKQDGETKYAKLEDLPFPKELIEDTMQKFKINGDFKIGSNLQRLRSILKGRKTSLTIREKDIAIAKKLFPEANLHNRQTKEKTVIRNFLEMLKYLKENDPRGDEVDLNKVVTSRRKDRKRDYTKLSELPFPKELIEDAIKKFGISGDFLVGQYFLYIKSALNDSKVALKISKEDIELAKVLFRSYSR